MQWPTLEESRRNSCRWNNNQECCLSEMRKESKNSIGWTKQLHLCFLEMQSSLLQDVLAWFTQARVIFQWHQAWEALCCSLPLTTWWASQCLLRSGVPGKTNVQSVSGRSGALWQPCQTAHLISAPVVVQMLLGSTVQGACAWSSPDSSGLCQCGDHGCLPAAKANASRQCFPSELLPGTSCQ